MQAFTVIFIGLVMFVPRLLEAQEETPIPYAQIEVEQVLGPGVNLNRPYRRYERGHDFGRISFAEHYYGLIKRKEKRGMIVLGMSPIIAAVGFGAGALMWKRGREINTTEDENGETSITLTGMAYGFGSIGVLSLATIGTFATLIAGSVIISRATKTLRRLKPLLDSDSYKTIAYYEKPRFDLGLMTARNGAPAGLSFQFTF